MKAGWETKRLEGVASIEYGTRVVQKRDGGTRYPVYGGGGATFSVDRTNRADCFIVSRFGMSAECVRYVSGEFFLNDSGLTVSSRNSETLWQRFLDYQLLAKQPDIYTLGRGTAQKNLDVDAFRAMLINVPASLDEQRRIVAVLDKAFANIATATANAQKNLTNARATLKSCLGDMFAQRGSKWQRFELGSVCLRLHQGLNTAGEKIEFHAKGYPIIQTRNIENGKVNTTEKMKFVSSLDWEKYKEKYRPEIGDVFFTNIGTIGKTAVIETDIDYLIHWNIFKLRPDFNVVLPYYLKIYLDYLTESGHFSKIQTGGTVNFVTKKMISTSEIFVPPISEQRDVVVKAESLTNSIERLQLTYEQKLIALTELKQSLLQKAFAGELT